MINKQEVVAAVRGHVEKMQKTRFADIPVRGLCGVYAAGVIHQLSLHGVRAVFQAGSASWPILAPGEDDGIRSTHFSYMWEPDSEQTLRRIAAGLLPELHVWVGVPSTQELIDVTTVFQPEQAMATAGLSWHGPTYDYIWCHAAETPTGVLYAPSLSAIKVAVELLHGFFRQRIPT